MVDNNHEDAVVRHRWSRISVSDGGNDAKQRTAMAPSESSGNGHSCDVAAHEGDSAGLGDLLRRARERRGLTLEQIANETKIPRRYLEALERDNLAALPSGFYRRAQIRTYARAVHVDQNLALARLDCASDPAVKRKAARETGGMQQPAFSRTRALIVVGVIVAGVVFGRAMGGREAARDHEAPPARAVDSPQPDRPLVRDMPPGDLVLTSARTSLDEPAPPQPTPALAAAIEPPTTPAASIPNGDAAAPATEAEARPPAEAVTELVVTTEPAGARVTVNGIGWGVAPVTIRYLPPGDSLIRVSKEGYAAEERTVSVAEGRRRTVDIQLRGTP